MNPAVPSPVNSATTDYQRLKELLCELADLPSDEREVAARNKLNHDPVLLSRVLKMLEGLEQEEGFLEAELPGLLGFEALLDDSIDPGKQEEGRLPGASIGHFKIINRLGEGGMAVVYRALQTEPVKRNVALKVISIHATSIQRIRFERECSTLARFAHPNVAVMYESGVSPAGEPYVAMELIEGFPITDWCKQHQASIEQRIQLFIEVCQGLTHAHGKGILHRDIKPANLLVTEIDGKPVVKVIDFGIAAALTPGIDQLSNLTGQHLIGTPAYMSPESVHISDRQSLDARSDVYSLGVVLFELLCGKRPYDVYDLPLADWVKSLATRNAPHINHVFNRLPVAEKQAIARAAGTGPNRLARLLDSDLNAILGKAMALEPERRYESSHELAEELHRYLGGKAVNAHPPGRIYLTRKFLKRHWLGASFLAAMVLSLAGGIVARELEVRHTRLALEESNAISAFLVDLLEHASPLRLEGEDVLLQDIIDRGSEQLSERFADQPAVHARMLHTLGRIYGERGDYPYGGKLMEEALALMQSPAGVNNPEGEVRLLSDLGVAYRRQGRMEESQQILLEGLEKARSLSPAQPLLEAEMENSLGNVYVVTEDYPRAETHHSRALALRQAELPAGDLQITSSKNNLASVFINSWQLDRALPYAQQTLAEWTAGLPAGHPWIAIARNNLSIIFDRLGMKQEALQLLLEALADSQQRLGPDHPDVADIWRNISNTLIELGKRQEGREALEEYVRIISGSLGPGAPRTLAAERRTAALDLFDQQYARALDSLDSIQKRLPPIDRDSNLSMQVEFDRVRALMGLHRYDEARGILLSIAHAQGTNYLEQKRLAALVAGETGNPEIAIQELLVLQKLAQQDLSERDPIHGGILMDLTQMAMESRDYTQAIDFASRAYSFWKSIYRTSLTLQAQQWLGRANIEAGQRSTGMQQLTEAVQGLRNFLPADHPYLLDVESRLAEYSSTP